MFNRKSFLKIVLFATVLAVALPLGSVAFAGGKGPLVQVQAKGSVDDTLVQLKKMVASGGMMVMGELHQGKVLEMTGLRVTSETIFVGSPTVGKNLFTADPAAGIAVPIRINVFDDGQGNTFVSYVPPSHLLNQLGNEKVNKIAKMLDGKLENLVSMLGT
jgi:uncharacterized protein (DUF302 family)